ncbi:unnamed protein product [Amoebophrya sp. A120]|nr:unnamed protein product [Amoebophrya sp. A120]|eukprot:GSA120T00018708001.1
MSAASSPNPRAAAGQAQQAVNRVEQIANQLNVSPFTLKVGAGAVAGAVVSTAVLGKKANFPVEAPPKNTAETLPVFEEGEIVYTADPAAEVKLHPAKAGPASLQAAPAETIIDIIGRIEAKSPNVLCLSVERPCPKNDGQGALSLPPEKWTSWTWKEFIEDSKLAAKAFMELGMAHFGSVTCFGVNAPEWHLSAIGSILAGGKVAGIYPSDTVEHCIFKNKCAGATVAIVETCEKAKMVLDNIAQLPRMKAVVVFDPEAKFEEVTSGAGCKYMRWDTMMKWAKTLKNQDAELKQRMNKIRPGHAMNVVYTSGTTGNPKGVMLSQDNSWSTCAIFLKPVTQDLTPPHRILSYLPLPHVTGFLADIALPMWLTANSQPTSIYFARPYDLKESTIGSRLLTVRPTIFVAVPRVYEKIAEKLKAVAATVTGPMKAISTWAKAKNSEHMGMRQFGKGNGEYPANFTPANFVMGKVRQKLGLDQAQCLISGAAPITMETLDYFGSLGLMILELYGMSESTGPTTLNTLRTVKWGTIGYAPQGVEVGVFNTMDPKNPMQWVKPCADLSAPSEQEQGELCFRGRHIMMGYLANPDLGEEHMAEVKKKNKEALVPGGWMLSGDKACMDKDGFFRITGRYKELIITAGGENVAPVPIEDWLKSNYTAISNVMMVGDKKKYNVILVTLKTKGATGELPGGDELDGEALKIAPGVTSLAQAMKDDRVLKYIQGAVDAVNKEPKIVISNACKVQFFRILPRDFSIQTEEFTPTLKLKRSVAVEIWKDYIDQMYQ